LLIRPVTATLARETSEDPTSLPVEGPPEDPSSLMEGPPHGVQIADPPDDHGVQTYKEEKAEVEPTKLKQNTDHPLSTPGELPTTSLNLHGEGNMEQGVRSQDRRNYACGKKQT
jgi:hypothetical protein